MKYYILKHNGEFKWDLVDSVEGLDSAIQFLKEQMLDNQEAQFIIKPVEQ